jgi:hypothetical protein
MDSISNSGESLQETSFDCRLNNDDGCAPTKSDILQKLEPVPESEDAVSSFQDTSEASFIVPPSKALGNGSLLSNTSCSASRATSFDEDSESKSSILSNNSGQGSFKKRKLNRDEGFSNICISLGSNSSKKQLL